MTSQQNLIDANGYIHMNMSRKRIDFFIVSEVYFCDGQYSGKDSGMVNILAKTLASTSLEKCFGVWNFSGTLHFWKWLKNCVE